MRGDGKRADGGQSERLAVAFAVAILLHAAVVPLLGHILPSAPMDIPESTEVEMVNLQPDEWNRNLNPDAVDSTTSPSRKVAAEAEKKEALTEEEKKAEEEKKKEERPPGQVVYIGPSGDGTAPDDARFLAEYNSKVEKETISRYRRSDYKNPLPTPSITKDMAGGDGDLKARGLAMRVEQKPPPEGQEQKKAAEPGVSKGLVDKLVLKIPDVPATPDLDLPVDNRVGMFSNSKRSEGVKGNSDHYELKMGGRDKVPPSLEDPLPPRLAALMPGPPGNIGRIEGGPFADHVEGVEEGEGTFLNAREYRYASFFNRVKKEVSMRWDPGVQLVKRDPTGGIYGQKDRLTILHVVLDEKGGLRKAEVAQGCGLDFLDQEAIQAFERAQPFPNPPTGLIKDGQISFNFGFFVEFSSSSFRMFRTN